MMEGLRDIIGVLIIIGLLVLLRRTFFLRKPPAKRSRVRRVHRAPPKSPNS
jgi:hypothetical protein